MSIFKDFFGEEDEDTILEENKQLRKKRKHDKEDYKKLKEMANKYSPLSSQYRSTIHFTLNGLVIRVPFTLDIARQKKVEAKKVA